MIIAIGIYAVTKTKKMKSDCEIRIRETQKIILLLKEIKYLKTNR